MASSSVANVSNKDYLHLDPHKELSHHIWRGRMYKAAAIASLLAYTVFALASAVAVGIYAPIYLPIILTATVLFADFFYNKVYSPINKKADNHYDCAKMNQGIVNELDKLDNKKDLLQARINYLDKRVKKCETKMETYSQSAEEANVKGKHPSLLLSSLKKSGQWLEKLLSSKIDLAYCTVLQQDPTYPAPKVTQLSFETRAYAEKFLKNVPIVTFKNGYGFNAHGIEKSKLEEIMEVMQYVPAASKSS